MIGLGTTVGQARRQGQFRQTPSIADLQDRSGVAGRAYARALLIRGADDLYVQELHQALLDAVAALDAALVDTGEQA